MSDPTEDENPEADCLVDGRSSPSSEPEDSAGYAGVEADFDSHDDPDFLPPTSDPELVEADLLAAPAPDDLTESRINLGLSQAVGASGINPGVEADSETLRYSSRVDAEIVNFCTEADIAIATDNSIVDELIDESVAREALASEEYLGIEADFDSSFSHPSPVHIPDAEMNNCEPDLVQLIDTELEQYSCVDEQENLQIAAAAVVASSEQEQSHFSSVNKQITDGSLNDATTEEEFYQPECDQCSDSSEQSPKHTDDQQADSNSCCQDMGSDVSNINALLSANSTDCSNVNCDFKDRNNVSSAHEISESELSIDNVENELSIDNVENELSIDKVENELSIANVNDADYIIDRSVTLSHDPVRSSNADTETQSSQLNVDLMEKCCDTDPSVPESDTVQSIVMNPSSLHNKPESCDFDEVVSNKSENEVSQNSDHHLTDNLSEIESDPETVQSVLKSFDSVPVTEDSAPVSEDIAPDTEDSTPTDDVAPITEGSVPVYEDSGPVTEGSTPVRPNEDCTPTEDVAPITEGSVPVYEDSVPIVEDSAPVSEDDMPVIAEDDIPVAEVDVPVTEVDVPVIQFDAHVTENDASVTEDAGPVSENGACVTEDAVSVNEHTEVINLGGEECKKSKMILDSNTSTEISFPKAAVNRTVVSCDLNISNQELGMVSGSQLEEVYSDELSTPSEGGDSGLGPYGILQPASLSEVLELQNLQAKCEEMQKKNAALENENKRLQSAKSEQDALNQEVTKQRDALRNQVESFKTRSADEVYLAQIKELEFTIVQLTKELKQTKDKLTSHDAAAKRAVGALQSELKLRVDQVTKMYEDCLREKDSMVVKYAQAEQKNLDLKRQVEKTESRMKDTAKEKETAVSRMKTIAGDKNRILAQLQGKHQETVSLSREMEKLKEALSSADVKVKWANNKLKAELDSHQETKGKIEKLQARLKESREETEQIRRDCQEMVKTYQESEEIKSVSLAIKVREKENELKTQLQETQDQEEVHQIVVHELDSLKRKHKDAVEEVKTLKDKVVCFEQERMNLEQMIAQYKDILQKQKADNKEIGLRLKDLHGVEDQLKVERDLTVKLKAELEEIKLTESDRVVDAENNQKQNVELLDLTQKLTDKNALLQSENTAFSLKVSSLSAECERFELLTNDQTKHIDILSRDLNKEKKIHDEETKELSEKLAEQTQLVKELATKVEEEKDENKTLKRRNAASIKDLTRQLQQARKRLEIFENQSPEKDSMSVGSRTSSSGSLDTLNSNGALQQTTNSSSSRASSHEPSQPQNQECEAAYTPNSTIVEPDRQMLIERIVKLQRGHARKNEKIEFIEDHNQQLLTELKKKHRIIQQYILREEAGALAPESVDLVKAQMSKKGGIMASLYNHSTDGAMSMELSLEINRKLQAVIEDTLLKNMTLKDNLDTLGAEIARLSQENRNLQLTMRKS